jgi:acyl dehydratase
VSTAELLPEGRITDEALEQLRSRIGMVFRVRRGNELVCRETVMSWVDGIGDVNPLYRDEAYAEKSRVGHLQAPPSWLYTVNMTAVIQGLPGVHGFIAGTDWTFHRPLVAGDRILPKVSYAGFEDKRSEFAGRMIMEHQLAEYTNQHQQLVAEAKTWIARTERAGGRGKGKYAAIQLPHPWTDEELARVEEEALAEEIRGDRVRYWEDVREGDELPTLVKGPFTLTDVVAFIGGWQGGIALANGVALRHYRAHPKWAFRDPATRGLEPMAAVHWNLHAAKAAGVPAPYDIGLQRHSWLMQFLTNWVGDDGWLKRCRAEYRRFVYFSDVVWLRGKVVRKYLDEAGECCVDIETTAYNQRGENTMPGEATVVLPSREPVNWPVTRRLAGREVD